MKITAFANFCDPQTLPMYETLYEKSGHELILAATEPMEEELPDEPPPVHPVRPYRP